MNNKARVANQEKVYHSDRIENILRFCPIDIVNQGIYTCSAYDDPKLTQVISLNVPAPTKPVDTKLSHEMSTTLAITAAASSELELIVETGLSFNVSNSSESGNNENRVMKVQNPQSFNSATVTLLTLIGVILALISTYIFYDYKQKNDAKKEWRTYASVPTNEQIT